MATYVALLRGINVSGQKPMKMATLVTSLEGIGFKNVRTYLQSGNVVFETAQGSEAVLSKKIFNEIQKRFGFSVPTLVRTAPDIKRTIERNPFLKMKKIELDQLYVTFLDQQPSPEALEKLAGLNFGADQFRVNGREIYLSCPGGYGRTKLSNTFFEKVLSVSATTRNWRTVNQLLEMSSDS